MGGRDIPVISRSCSSRISIEVTIKIQMDLKYCQVQSNININAPHRERLKAQLLSGTGQSVRHSETNKGFASPPNVHKELAALSGVP